MITLWFVVAQSDDSGSAGTALIAFFAVMAIVIGVLIYLQNRRKDSDEPDTLEERDLTDEESRQRSFDEKMRRVEQRLRSEGAASADDGPDADGSTETASGG